VTSHERDDQVVRVNAPANYIGARPTVNFARTLRSARRRVSLQRPVVNLINTLRKDGHQLNIIVDTKYYLLIDMISDLHITDNMSQDKKR